MPKDLNPGDIPTPEFPTEGKIPVGIQNPIKSAQRIDANKERIEDAKAGISDVIQGDTEDETPQETTPKKPLSGKKIGIIAGAAAVVVALVIGGVVIGGNAQRTAAYDAAAKAHNVAILEINSEREVTPAVIAEIQKSQNNFETNVIGGLNTIANAPSAIISDETKAPIQAFIKENTPAKETNADLKIEEVEYLEVKNLPLSADVTVTDELVTKTQKAQAEFEKQLKAETESNKELTLQVTNYQALSEEAIALYEKPIQEALANKDAWLAAHPKGNSIDPTNKAQLLAEKVEQIAKSEEPTLAEKMPLITLTNEYINSLTATKAGHDAAVQAETEAAAAAASQQAQYEAQQQAQAQVRQPLWGNSGTQVPDNSGRIPAPAPAPQAPSGGGGGGGAYVPPPYNPGAAPTDPCVATNSCIKPNF